MARGRPVKSQIRQNIVEILAVLREGYAYEIYKIYRDIFPKVTMRSIYYHLKKGTTLGEFKVSQVKQEQGNFSWGSSVEKICYVLGPNAVAIGKKEVKDYLTKIGKI